MIDAKQKAIKSRLIWTMSVQSSIPNLNNFRYTFSTYSIEPFGSILLLLYNNKFKDIEPTNWILFINPLLYNIESHLLRGFNKNTLYLRENLVSTSLAKTNKHELHKMSRFCYIRYNIIATNK